MESIIIYGAGNSGRKALETLIRQNSYHCIGFIDDKLDKGTAIQNSQVIGSNKDISYLQREGVTKAFVAIGNNHSRKRIVDELQSKGFDLVSLIDPSAFVSCEASIGKGVLLMHNVYVGHSAKLEDLVVCQVGAIISHYTTIGEAANIGYGGIVSAYASVGKFSKIGIGAKITNKIQVGESSLIGAGAVVTKPIPSGVVAYGVPAKVIREIDIKKYDPNGGE